jgi:uncharacterized protein YcbX
MIHLSGLYRYPVKSLRGCAVPTAEIDALGLAGDRRFLVVDETGRFRTQRTLPRMALIATALDAGSLTLSADGAGAISVPTASDPDAPRRVVSVWKSERLQAEDGGELAAAWLTDFLGEKSRLVRIGRDFERPALKPSAVTGDRLNFADAYPFLIVSEASLAELNDRLVAQGEAAVPMNRFRPNFVVTGCPAFAEDTWQRLKIGEVTLRAGGPCGRCVMTTTDQETAERGLEPLRTLAKYRRNAGDPTNVDFGQNLFHETKTGTIRVGDRVHVAAG